MKVKNIKERINAAVNKNDDPILLEMVLQIFQDSASVSSSKVTKTKKVKSLKKWQRDGRVAYSDVLRQGQGCLPPGSKLIYWFYNKFLPLLKNPASITRSRIFLL